MATIREYFDTEAKDYAVCKNCEFRTSDGTVLANILAKIVWDLEGNAKYWYFYVPEVAAVEACIASILIMQETENCEFSPEPTQVQSGLSGYSEYQNSETLVFTRRIHIYIDSELTVDVRKNLVNLGLGHAFHLYVRDREYAKRRSDFEQPLAFISHDSRDKDTLVRELAHELTKLMCPVWYDEYSLKVGDSLRASIEKGLKECRKCIVVLSPSFLANSGWGKAEFDSVFTREILDDEHVILPVWHNVDVKQVYQYSPRLADKLGLSSSLGAKELARRLYNVIK